MVAAHSPAHGRHGHSHGGHGGHGGSISVDEHRQRILATIEPLPARETPLAEALGLTLAADVLSRVDVPGFDNSSMDGYAVRHADAAAATAENPVALEVVADLPAGSSLNPALRPGQAARIMTGAPVPDDADSIVPVEDSDAGTETVLIGRAPEAAAFVRRRGADIRAGGLLLPAGRTLGARDLAAAAAGGLSTLAMHRAPRVGVLSTGDELRVAGEPLGHGQIHDSNSVLLAALVAEAGGIPVPIGVVPDSNDALRDTLARHAPDVDVFITSGGVSVGAYDVVKAVLAPLGVWFGPVRMQPGKPQGFGRWADGTPLFALPGNPVSVFVSFEAFVRPALLALQARKETLRPTLEAVAAEGWHSPAGRAQYMPVVLRRSGEGHSIRPASSLGSGSYLVASLAGANALAVIAEDVTEVLAGDTITVIPLDGGPHHAPPGES